MTDLDEAARRVREGQASAFRPIVEATSARLVRLAARILGSVADAEDAVQEAYTKAYSALSGGKFDGRSRVDVWLYRIVARTAIDALRARSRRRDRSDVAMDTAIDPGASPEASFALLELDAWLGGLLPNERAAVVLKAVEGRTAAETAEILSITEGAVEQLLVRARAKLREREADPHE